MKKKFSITFLVAIFTMMLSLSTLAAETKKSTILISPKPTNTIKVQLDGEYVDFTDEAGNIVNPEILNNRTMVPMRKIFEIFEAEVNWNGETRTVVATTAEKEITLTINSDKAKVKDLVNDEEKEITLDTVPVLLNNRTMVPVRFIAESLEKEVGWDADERTVIIIDFDKFEKKLEERVPILKEIFELELEAVESFKTVSDIEGKLIYKDKKNKANNETVKINGSLEMNMNKAKEMMMDINLEFSGKGTIYNSIKDAGYKELGLAFIMADGNTFVSLVQNGEETWANLGSDLNSNSLSSLTAVTPKSYSEFLKTVSESLGELDSTSYAVLELIIQTFENVYSEENVKITGSSNNKTMTFEIDIIEFMNELTGEPVDGLENTEMEMKLVQKIANKKVDSTVITIKMLMEEPTSEEMIEIEFKLDMDFKSVNKDFEIEAPKI